uniref:hypothetical protein n=1 Tax=Helicobacter labacensis TaxID=2316079 RepID=UPI0013CE01EA
KVFFEVHLEKILQKQDLESFLYFYHLFNATNFLETQEQRTKILEVLKSNEDKKADINAFKACVCHSV